MSGVEFVALLGISASVIQVLEACTKVLRLVQQFHNNDAAFQDLALQLPLLAQTLESLNTPAYRQRLDAATEKALMRVLEGCRRQLDALDGLIRSMTPAETASKLKRTWHGFRSFGKDTRLREIVGVLAEYKATITLHLSAQQTEQVAKADTSAGATRSFFEVPAQRVSHFVNRPRILQRIGEAIEKSQINPAVVVLTGVGGQGKTQLALEFSRQAASEYKAIFWIDASSEVSTVRSFEKIVAKISAAGQEFADSPAKVAFVKETLRTWPERWLLVFDNYDSPHTFRNVTDFFPASYGEAKNCVLVTSRTALSERLGTCVKVNGLAEDEALELLTSRSPAAQKFDTQEGKKIVKQLGYLALAIDQAAAYISIRQLPLSLFTEHYEKRKEFILKHTPDSLWEYRTRTGQDGNSSGENLSVLTTWELSFLQIQGNDQEREELGDFLTQSAFLDPTSISESLFSNFFQVCAKTQGKYPSWMSPFLGDGSWDSFRFQDAIVGLMNLSLIQTVSVTSDGAHFSLHPLIKDWLQLRKSITLRREMSFTAISMTASLIRDTDSENLPLSARQELLGHIDSCVENAQQFLKTPESKTIHGGLIEGFQTVLASFYSRHDRHADAENLFTEALVYQKRELGNFHVETMCTMNELGALYLKMGDVKNAEFMLTESLQAKERALGPDHPRTLNTVNNIGNLYSLQLQLDKATEMYQRVLEGYTKLYGPKDRSVAEAWNNLGEISMKQGRFSVAQEQFVTALETVRGSAGGDTAFILYLKSNLALMYKFENLFNLAKDLYSEVIEGRSVMLGVGHSSTLQSMCEMGDVFLAEGNKQAAEVWYVKGKASVERRKKTERELEAGEKAVKTKMEDDVGFYPIWTDLSSGHNHPGGHKKPDSPNAPFPTSTIPRLAEDDDDTDDGMDLDPYPPSRQTSRVDEDHIMSNIPSVSRALQQPSQPFLIDRVGHDDRQSWGTFSPARAYGAPPSFQGSYGSSWRYSTQAPPRAQPLIHSPSNGNPTPHNGSFNRLSSQPSPGRSPNASLRPSWNDGRSGYYRQQTGALAFDPPSRVGWDSPQATSYGAAADRLGWNYSQVGSYGAGADQLGMGSNIRISPSPCEYIERGGVCLHNINHSWLLNSEGWS